VDVELPSQGDSGEIPEQFRPSGAPRVGCDALRPAAG
jgi:hypothetical protein